MNKIQQVTTLSIVPALPFLFFMIGTYLLYCYGDTVEPIQIIETLVMVAIAVSIAAVESVKRLLSD